MFPSSKQGLWTLLAAMECITCLCKPSQLLWLRHFVVQSRVTISSLSHLTSTACYSRHHCAPRTHKNCKHSMLLWYPWCFTPSTSRLHHQLFNVVVGIKPLSNIISTVCLLANSSLHICRLNASIFDFRARSNSLRDTTWVSLAVTLIAPLWQTALQPHSLASSNQHLVCDCAVYLGSRTASRGCHWWSVCTIHKVTELAECLHSGRVLYHWSGAKPDMKLRQHCQSRRTNRTSTFFKQLNVRKPRWLKGRCADLSLGAAGSSLVLGDFSLRAKDSHPRP